MSGKFINHNNIPHLIHKIKPNLTKAQLQTIKTLRDNSQVIIKPADKGGAIVVMNTEKYKQEALRQLNNTTYYVPLEGPIYPETAIRINEILHQMFIEGFISNAMVAYLRPNPQETNSRYFYLLPKIHKPRQGWPDPQMPPGHPIVSDVNTESSGICEFIDYFLQPYSTTHPAYTEDTYHFISKIRGTTIDPNWLLITVDVESLYTKMRIDLILDSIKEVFSRDPSLNRPEQGLLNLLEVTLRNNDFEFNGDFYLQICGIAMGRKYAPSAANIYLRKAAMQDFHIQPHLYSRFLDDIFALWPGTKQQLTEYQEFLNNLIPGIKVTFTIRNQIIEFLDVHIYKHYDSTGTCTLQTKVSVKLSSATDCGTQLFNANRAKPATVTTNRGSKTNAVAATTVLSSKPVVSCEKVRKDGSGVSATVKQNEIDSPISDASSDFDVGSATSNKASKPLPAILTPIQTPSPHDEENEETAFKLHPSPTPTIEESAPNNGCPP